MADDRRRNPRWEYRPLTRSSEPVPERSERFPSDLTDCAVGVFEADDMLASGSTSLGLLSAKYPVVFDIRHDQESWPNLPEGFAELAGTLPAGTFYWAGWFSGAADVMDRSHAFPEAPRRLVLREGSAWDWVVWAGTKEQVLRGCHPHGGPFQCPHFVSESSGRWTILVDPGLSSALLGCTEDLAEVVPKMSSSRTRRLV